MWHCLGSGQGGDSCERRRLVAERADHFVTPSRWSAAEAEASASCESDDGELSIERHPNPTTQLTMQPSQIRAVRLV
jgi:hypothetical protein